MGGDRAVTDDRAFRLATFDAVDRLMAQVFDDEFLRSMQPVLEREKFKVLSDREGFIASLDELAEAFAVEAKRRNLSTGSTPPAPGAAPASE